MAKEILYHGAKGDSILGIMATGTMTPRDGKVFFAVHRWESALMHGADTTRKASFVMKIQVQIPADAIRYRTSTAGVADTLVVETWRPIPAVVLELYARRPAEDGFQLQHLIGADAIKSHLS